MQINPIMPFKGIFLKFLLLFLFLNVKIKNCFAKTESLRDGEEGLTNTWAVELDTNDEEVAKEVARSYGYDYVGRIGSLPMHFKFVKREKDTVDSMKGVQEDDDSEGDKHEDKRMLENHPRVKWAEQQRTLIREKHPA